MGTYLWLGTRTIFRIGALVMGQKNQEQDFGNFERAGSGDTKGNTTDHLDSFRAAANLFAKNDVKNAPTEYAKIDVEKEYGSESDYLKSAAKNLRQSFQLSDNASSEQLYQKMAKSMFSAYQKGSPQEQREAREHFGLTGKVTEQTYHDGLMRKERQELKLGSGASFQQIEEARYKKEYQMMKDGTMPIDYD